MSKTIQLKDDTVRIERVLPEWSDMCVFLLVGKHGQCYNREGKRTYLFCFSQSHQLSDTEQAHEFAFDTREIVESLMGKLPQLRGEVAA